MVNMKNVRSLFGAVALLAITFIVLALGYVRYSDGLLPIITGGLDFSSQSQYRSVQIEVVYREAYNHQRSQVECQMSARPPHHRLTYQRDSTNHCSLKRDLSLMRSWTNQIQLFRACNVHHRIWSGMLT